jgi:hypothetical protein
MATPDFCARYQSHFEPLPDGRRIYFGDCSVGCVELAGMLAGTDDEEMDRALVQVRWSGFRYARRGGKPAKASAFNELHDTLLVLGRRRGVKTRPEHGLNSAHCPCCGAPEERLASHACESCGVVLNDGSHGWVLLQTLKMQSSDAQYLILRSESADYAAEPTAVTSDAEGGPPTGNGADDGVTGTVGLLGWSIGAALANGRIADEERDMLLCFARRGGVRESQLDALIDGTLRSNLRWPQPKDQRQAKRWLAAMADMGLADGKLGPSEYVLLQRVGAEFQIDRSQVKQLVRERKRELFREAREALLTWRKGE